MELDEELAQISCLTFPHDEDFPPARSQLPHVPPVPFDVAQPLGLPEIRVRLRNHLPILTSMHMPETAMNEDNLAVARKYKIGSPGQITSMQTESVTHVVNETAYNNFRLRVLASNGLHIPTPLICGEDIHEIPF